MYKTVVYKILFIIFLLVFAGAVFPEENYDTQTGASIRSSSSNDDDSSNSRTITTQTDSHDNFSADNGNNSDAVTSASQKDSQPQENKQNTNTANYNTIQQNNYDSVTNASKQNEKLAYNTETTSTTTTSTSTTSTTVYHFTTTTTSTSTTSTTVYHFTTTTTSTSTTSTTVYHFTTTTTSTSTTSTTVYHFTTTTLPSTTTTTVANNNQQNLYVYNNRQGSENNQSTNDTEQGYFELGKKLLLHSNYDRAIYNFSKAIEKNANPDYYRYRSIAAYGNDEIAKAIIDNKMAISKDNTKYSSYILYLYYTAQISNREFELAKNVVESEQSKIKGSYGQKILNYFLGKSTLSSILKFDITTNLTRQQFICKSYCYAGLLELLKNNIKNAKTCFEISMETNEKKLDTYYLSKIEYEKILDAQ